MATKMSEDFVNPSNDILERLQAIHGMFNQPISHISEKPKLNKVEKVDPSEKLLEKLKLYESCDGSVQNTHTEKLRKEYFEGLQFNTMQTAIQLFKASSENREARKADIQNKSDLPVNIVSKGTIEDIRSVFTDATNYNEMQSTANGIGTIGGVISLTDNEWLSASNESRIRKLLTLSLPYLRSYQEMTSDLVLDSVRRAFLDMSHDITNIVNGDDECTTKTTATTNTINDRQWFLELDEQRVETLIQKASQTTAGKADLDEDMWFKVRSALIHCVSSTASIFNKRAKVDRNEGKSSMVNSGLTSQKVEKILSEIKKEFKRTNKKFDMKIVEGITSDLKKRIQLAMEEHDRRRSSRSDNLVVVDDSDFQSRRTPEKLNADRLNRIFSEYNREFKKSTTINPIEFEGLTSSIKEKLIAEMSKEPKKLYSRTVDVQSGTTRIAKEKLIEDINEKTIGKSRKPSASDVPKMIDQDILKRFIDAKTSIEPSSWTPDVDVQAGIAKERVLAFSTEAGDRAMSEWTPDVPITEGIARSTIANIMNDKHEKTRDTAWSPDIHVESGLARDRAEQILAASTLAPSSSSTTWQPDVPLVLGSVSKKTEQFLNDQQSLYSGDEREWKPDVELPNGLTKQRIQNLYEQCQQNGHLEFDANDANELIQAGLTKGRLEELFAVERDKKDKEWTPDVELKKGLTKERTSLFHNLETLRQQNQQSNNEEYEGLKKLIQTPAANRVVVEVENEPIPPDPNIARNDKTSEQAQIQSGHTKLILERLKDAYTASEESHKDDHGVISDISLSAGHAKTLRQKFADFQTDAKTVHTTVEKQCEIPRRFVSNPAPVPMQLDAVTEERCLCCKQTVYSTEGIYMDNKGYVHKRCMRCPVCQKIPLHTEARLENNQIFCVEHVSS